MRSSCDDPTAWSGRLVTVDRPPPARKMPLPPRPPERPDRDGTFQPDPATVRQPNTAVGVTGEFQLSTVVPGFIRRSGSQPRPVARPVPASAEPLEVRARVPCPVPGSSAK
jgi:hypothetical protein